MDIRGSALSYVTSAADKQQSLKAAWDAGGHASTGHGALQVPKSGVEPHTHTTVAALAGYAANTPAPFMCSASLAGGLELACMHLKAHHHAQTSHTAFQHARA